MWSKLEKIFIAIGLDYTRQGSYESEELLPSSFFTFWNYDTPDDGFFDNKANRRIWVWQIYFYTNNPSLIYSKLEEFIVLAKQEGFIIEGNGSDIPSGAPNYFGRMVRIRFIENYNEEEN